MKLIDFWISRIWLKTDNMKFKNYHISKKNSGTHQFLVLYWHISHISLNPITMWRYILTFTNILKDYHHQVQSHWTILNTSHHLKHTINTISPKKWIRQTGTNKKYNPIHMSTVRNKIINYKTNLSLVNLSKWRDSKIFFCSSFEIQNQQTQIKRFFVLYT